MPFISQKYFKSFLSIIIRLFLLLRNFFLSLIGIVITFNFIIFLVTSFNNEIYEKLSLIPFDFTHTPWTILTNIFLHSGYDHIFFNMLFMYILGIYIIRLLGKRNFLLIYFISGIFGSVLYLLLALYTSLGEPVSRLVGASSIFYAFATILFVIDPKMNIYIIPIWGMLIILLLVSIPYFVPFVAWQGHLGGFLVGLIAGFFFRRSRRFIYIV